LNRQTRKEFLKITGLMAGGFLFNKKIHAAKLKKDIASAFSIRPNLNYFNNGTLGPSPIAVQEAIIERIKYVDSTLSYSGLEAEALQSIAAFVGVKPTEIAFTHNVTEGINIAAWGISLEKGDEILMTKHEHAGGALPWLNRQKIEGIQVKTFDISTTVTETLTNLKESVTKKTKVIAIPHILCTIGQVLPIKEIAEFARTKNIITVIDGAHPVGMMPLNIKDIGCDVYVSCCHKWLCGPKGMGLLYVNQDFRQKLTPKFIGALSADWDASGENKGLKEYVDDAHQYFYGTTNSANYAGLIAAIDYQNKIGKQQIFEIGNKLAQSFKSFLLENNKYFSLLTPMEAASSANIVTFRFKDKSLDLANYLRINNCVVRYVAESNLDCARASFHLYNNEKQLATLQTKIMEFVKSN